MSNNLLELNSANREVRIDMCDNRLTFNMTVSRYLVVRRKDLSESDLRQLAH